MEHSEDVAVGGTLPRASAIGASIEEHFARTACRGEAHRASAVLEMTFASLDDLAARRGQWTAETVLDEVAQRLLRAEVGVVRIDHPAHELVAVTEVDQFDEVRARIRAVLADPVLVGDEDVSVGAEIEVTAIATGESWPSALDEGGEPWVERRAIRSARLYVRDVHLASEEISAVRRWCADLTVVGVDHVDAAERLEVDRVVALPTLVIERRGMPTRVLVGDLDEDRLRRELG